MGVTFSFIYIYLFLFSFFPKRCSIGSAACSHRKVLWRRPLISLQMQQRQCTLLGDGGMGRKRGGGCKHLAERRESKKNQSCSRKTLEPLPTDGGVNKTQRKSPTQHAHTFKVPISSASCESFVFYFCSVN